MFGLGGRVVEPEGPGILQRVGVSGEGGRRLRCGGGAAIFAVDGDLTLFEIIVVVVVVVVADDPARVLVLRDD